MMQGMSKERLVRLAFTKGQIDTLLRWEHAREFEFKNQMYDVLERQELGDSCIYWCWWDQEETLLNRHLDDLAKKAFTKDPQQQKAQDLLFQFFKSVYCNVPDTLESVIRLAPDEFSQRLIWGENNEHHSWKQRPPFPPPKLV